MAPWHLRGPPRLLLLRCCCLLLQDSLAEVALPEPHLLEPGPLLQPFPELRWALAELLGRCLCPKAIHRRLRLLAGCSLQQDGQPAQPVHLAVQVPAVAVLA